MRGMNEHHCGKTQVAYDAHDYWTSYYKAQLRGRPSDWITIGAGTEVEGRFHYNATENSIIRAMLRREPVAGMTATVWRFIQKRRSRRLLDIGSGTGHWIDFFRNVFFFAEAVGVEIAPQMAEYLREKYANNPAVKICSLDISDSPFALRDDRFDLVSAIGVIFHVVDDGRWHQAIKNLASVLKPGGVLIVGGDFGVETRNVQFHASDHFEAWSDQIQEAAAELRVNKRVRSLAEWHKVATNCGLVIADLVRSDRELGVATPENDVLVLESVA
jgi:SAM-dependent methyltransferase